MESSEWKVESDEFFFVDIIAFVALGDLEVFFHGKVTENGSMLRDKANAFCGDVEGT